MNERHDSPVPGRATIAEIARAAGVSTATVDRTLNNRAGVKARTRTEVLDAAVRLGYLPEHRAVATGTAAASRTIEFVLPGGTNTFLKLLSEHLGAIADARRAEAQVRVHHIEGFNPEALARKLLDLKNGANAIGVLPLDHPVVREAIREVVAGGVPVLTHGQRHLQRPAARLCRHRQPRRWTARRPPPRPLHAAARPRDRTLCRKPQLSRPRGAGDGVPPHPR